MTGVASFNYRDTSMNTGTKNLPNVNPALLPSWQSTPAESETAKIKTAVIALNNLTTNTFVSLKLIMTEDISTFETEAQQNV